MVCVAGEWGCVEVSSTGGGDGRVVSRVGEGMMTANDGEGMTCWWL